MCVNSLVIQPTTKLSSSDWKSRFTYGLSLPVVLIWFDTSTYDLAVGTHDVSLGCWEVRELWTDGLAQLQLSSGCTARGGMRRASRAPPKSLQDPE